MKNFLPYLKELNDLSIKSPNKLPKPIFKETLSINLEHVFDFLCKIHLDDIATIEHFKSIELKIQVDNMYFYGHIKNFEVLSEAFEDLLLKIHVRQLDFKFILSELKDHLKKYFSNDSEKIYHTIHDMFGVLNEFSIKYLKYLGSISTDVEEIAKAYVDILEQEEYSNKLTGLLKFIDTKSLGTSIIESPNDFNVELRDSKYFYSGEIYYQKNLEVEKRLENIDESFFPDDLFTNKKYKL